MIYITTRIIPFLFFITAIFIINIKFIFTICVYKDIIIFKILNYVVINILNIILALYIWEIIVDSRYKLGIIINSNFN